jgi:hypothetical protein
MPIKTETEPGALGPASRSVVIDGNAAGYEGARFIAAPGPATSVSRQSLPTRPQSSGSAPMAAKAQAPRASNAAGIARLGVGSPSAQLQPTRSALDDLIDSGFRYQADSPAPGQRHTANLPIQQPEAPIMDIAPIAPVAPPTMAPGPAGTGRGISGQLDALAKTNHRAYYNSVMRNMSDRIELARRDMNQALRSGDRAGATLALQRLQSEQYAFSSTKAEARSFVLLEDDD